MKKSLFTLFILLVCGFLAAQFVVWRNGEIIFQTSINKVDSITLYELDLPDTPDNPDDPDDPDNPDNPDDPDDPDSFLPNVPNPELGKTTVVLYVPEDTPEGCYAVGTVNGWGEKNTDMKFAPVESATDTRWVSYTFDYAVDMQIKVLAIPSDPAVAPSWSFQWGKNMDPENDLQDDNVVILQGDGELVLENQGQPKLTTLADGGVVFIEVKAWALTPVIEAKVAETAAIKHPWNGGDWTYQEMTKVAEGKFEYLGRFGGNGVNIAMDVNGTGENWYPTEALTLEGDVATGDSVKFTFVSEKLAIGTVTVSLIEKGETQPEKPAKDITVKAKVPVAWTNTITAWVWPTNGEGKEVVPTKEGDWYVVTENCAELNVIFKNGEGWNGDANQTEDIKGISENTCFELYQEGYDKATATAVDCESDGNKFDLNFYTMVLMRSDENFYQIDGIDHNEDGENDTIYAVTFYILPESMYIQEYSLVGDDDYMLIMNTAIAVCYDATLGDNVAYSLGGYTFSDVEEEYCVEVDGEKRLIPHMATYTHFDEEKYLTVYGLLFEEREDEANAYVAENGYWKGDLDSYVAYVNFEYPQLVEGGYLVGGAGLECGSNQNYDLDFYEFQLQLFEKPYAYGFATEMIEDPEIGEPFEQFVWPLEMGNFVEKTYTYGERKSDPEEVQARILKKQRVKDNNFGVVPFEAFKKQMLVNRLLYKSLTYNKSDLKVRK